MTVSLLIGEAMPEMAGPGQGSETTPEATRSPEQGERWLERVRERGGPSGLARPNRYVV
jgi:hypothetical protein